MATTALPKPISLGPDRWELNGEDLIISHGIGPWKKSIKVPVDTIQSVENEPADMTGAPRWVADKDPGQITVRIVAATHTICANHTGQLAEALRAAIQSTERAGS